MNRVTCAYRCFRISHRAPQFFSINRVITVTIFIRKTLLCKMVEAFGLDNYQGKRPIGLYSWDVIEDTLDDPMEYPNKNDSGYKALNKIYAYGEHHAAGDAQKLHSFLTDRGGGSV